MIRLRPLFSLLLGLLFCGQLSVAQQLDHVQGELLIKFSPEIQAATFVTQMNMLRNGSIALKQHRPVVPYMNIHAVTFDHNTFNENDLMAVLSRQPDVEIVQFNHLITKRSTVPNDPSFNDQWQYINTGQIPNSVVGADLDIDLAWDITTGGLSSIGDTIVVCVVDDGLNPQHMDFGTNLWANHAEIPGNSIDDDNNGYVDDIHGWDTYDNDGDPLSTSGGDWHGTPVAGIVGGKGDNGIGITGVNWNVKIMMVRGGGNEANALASYSYPLAMRKKFNQTNGQEGAFVVATNSSWGTDNGRPEDAPLWCAMYDTMGVYGILSAGATANSNEDIDVVGDLPTACSSEYLLSVTNLNERDVKVNQAGYGLTTIDLGAYGENTYTVATPNTYGGFGGTSGATPHVAGAIGLLYSTPCVALASMARTNPAAAARLVRDAIFQGVTPNSSLDGITVTGGRLNIYDAMLALLINCGPCPPLVSLQVTDAFTDGLNVSWTSNDSVQSVDLQYRSVGEVDWQTISTTGSSYLLTGLDICSSYEVRVRGICQNEMSEYTDSIVAKTDGCCDIPVDIESTNIQENSIEVSWNAVTASTAYVARIREQGSNDWESNTTTNTFYNFSGLNGCATYEMQIQTTCADSSSAFSQLVVVNTPGCGTCLDFDYCEAFGAFFDDDYIQSCTFQDFENNSGSDSGYGDYTTLAIPHAERDRGYTISIKAGFNQFLDENCGVWIDFDANGEFSSDEKVLELIIIDSTGVSAEISIPSDAVLGATRMRVGLRFARDPRVCDNGGSMFGEFEDYCLTIDENSGISTTGPEELSFDVYPNPVVDQLIFKTTDFSIAQGQLMIIDQSGRLLTDRQVDFSQNEQKTMDVSDLPSGVYIVRYQTSNQAYVFTKKVVKL